MMNSQEQILEQGTTEDVAKEETAVANDEQSTENVETTTTETVDTLSVATEEPERKRYANKREVLDRVKEIAHSDDALDKDEVDYLKTIFYKMHKAEQEASLKAYQESGGDPDAYQYVPDPDEEEFKAEMGIIKEKRNKLFREQEEEKEANLQRKLEIIEKVKAMATSPDEANKSYKEFKALQQEWKEIKNVPAPKASELWRNYQLYVEQFYDLLKLNSEAREYDFKKNLEIKTHLCEAAEKLADEADPISAFHQLQQLHEEYRETGPVAKDIREQIWVRFKAASTVINKRHQEHFENLRAKEEENLVRKTELCEKAEAVAAEENKGSGDWDKHAKQIMELQAEWKTIGFAPQKMNVKIFERFRRACDDFFGRKAEFYKSLNQEAKDNAEKKRALIAQANELKDSTEWKATANKFLELQKEWKTIGYVPKKLGDQLWADFLAACNHFFEARNAANSGQRTEERANLQKKREIVEKLKTLAENADDDARDTVRQLTEEFNAIGHVPFKDKDKLYDDYHATLDKLRETLNISVAKRKLSNFKNKLKSTAAQGSNALDSERARLMRQYEAIKSEVQTYENNIGFLNASSKKGNSLIEEMNRRVQKLKDDLALVRDKIKAMDSEQ